MTEKISISLYGLAYGCHLYGAMTGFDVPLNEARQRLQPAPDLLNPDHRDATLHFLRAWGCRHLAIADNDRSSEALRSWAQDYGGDLPKPGRSLETLSEEELAALARAYEALATRHAGQQTRFGPVAAAKTLFLLRRLACPPWDNAIRKRLDCDKLGGGYKRYLGEVRRFVVVLADEAGVSVSELPGLVRRKESSAAELVDEYLWVRYTRGCEPPTPDVLGRWITWSRGATHGSPSYS